MMFGFKEGPRPLKKKDWTKMMKWEKVEWLRCMRAEFPHIPITWIAKKVGLNKVALQRFVAEECKDAQKQNGGISFEEKAEWIAFWETIEPCPDPIDLSPFTFEKKEPKLEPGGILQVRSGEKVVVYPMIKDGSVKFSGTITGKAEDVLNALKVFGLADGEITVTIGG